MKHLDLFSGIGGFALAAEWVWPEITHTFCDNDPFARAILKKHWPTAEIYGDIRTLTNTSSGRREGRGIPARSWDEREGATDADRPYILTGGFPCQPFSQAGRRKGTADDRYLWPEMFRVIREFRPRWVIAENVRGLVNWNDGLVLERVLADLESAHYEAFPLLIPACAVGAPHRRDRIWIIANTDGDGALGEGRHGNRGDQKRHTTTPIQKRAHLVARLAAAGGDAPDAASEQALAAKQRGLHTEPRRATADDPHTESIDVGRGRSKAARHNRERDRKWRAQRRVWDEHWLEAAARLCLVDDGLSGGLVRPRGWRNAALKAAGNAIVPQVAYKIMRAIKLADV